MKINRVNNPAYLVSIPLSFLLPVLRLRPHFRSGVQPKYKLKPKLIMKVTIKEWNAVATWRWDMPEDEVCGICRVQFDGTCPTCKFPGDDCSLCMPFPQLIESPVLIVYQ